MRTAILFSGTAYNFPYSIQSLMDNVVVPNDADVFILTSRYNRRRWAPHTEQEVHATDPRAWAKKSHTIVRETRSIKLHEIAHIKSVFGARLKVIKFVENMPEYRRHLDRGRERMMSVVNSFRESAAARKQRLPFADVITKDDGNIKCVVDQYHHVHRCYEMMEHHERAEGFRYDYVVRMRLDFIAPEKLIFAHYYLNQDYPYLYVLGSFRTDEFEWADEFCWFSKRNTAAKLFPRLDDMGTIVADRKYKTIDKKHEYLFAPETQFSILLHELAMKVVNVKIYRSACYTTGADGRDYINYMFRRDPLNLDYEYDLACKGPSDINEHCPTLRAYAELCDHVTELGTRFGNSTVAFMAARPGKFVSYDVTYNEKIDFLKLLAHENDINFDFRQENPQSIEPTDFLFIDTNHHAEQCARELELHADKAQKFIGFHDTTTFWEKGQGYEKGGGLRYAIEPFLKAHPEWQQVYRAENNNGLLILERK